MRINFDSLNEAKGQLAAAQREIEIAAADVTSNLGSQFSGIIGLNEAGAIHGRAIKQDPASAQEILRNYSNQVGWATELLAAEIETLGVQEDSNARGLDLADTGGAVGSIGAGLPSQPSNQSVPLYIRATGGVSRCLVAPIG